LGNSFGEFVSISEPDSVEFYSWGGALGGLRGLEGLARKSNVCHSMVVFKVSSRRVRRLHDLGEEIKNLMLE
jgi:hypothetical protein